MKKKIVSLLLCLVMVAGLFAGCASTGDGASVNTDTQNTSKDTGNSGTGNSGSSDLKFAVVLHALNSSFYAKYRRVR
ncbi:MAG TPA: hypothetical protein PK604_13165 [Acetivibrio clariflavus]|nr:hypothetical protein [Acetivibrio clariflavus]